MMMFENTHCLFPNIDTIRHWLPQSAPLQYFRGPKTALFSLLPGSRVILVERIWVENERVARAGIWEGRAERPPVSLSPQLLSTLLHVFNDNPMLEHMSSNERDGVTEFLLQEIIFLSKAQKNSHHLKINIFSFGLGAIFSRRRRGAGPHFSRSLRQATLEPPLSPI